MGKPHGTWQIADPSLKTIQAAGQFVNGQAQGNWSFYHDSGKIMAVIRYHNGVPDGEYKFYPSQENPLYPKDSWVRGSFYRGRMYSERMLYDPGGRTLNQALFEDGRLVEALKGSVNEIDKQATHERKLILRLDENLARQVAQRGGMDTLGYPEYELKPNNQHPMP